MATYKLTCWSDAYDVKADLTQAAAQILVDGEPSGLQTADVQHRDDVMRVRLAAHLYRDTPDHDADFDNVAELVQMDD